MLSTWCKADEHETCSERVKLPAGKVYSCKCDCHKPEAAEEVVDDTYENWEDPNWEEFE